MKKTSFFMLTVGCLFAYSAKAQHLSKSESVTKTPPKVLYQKMINNANMKNQEYKMVLVTFAPGESSEAHRHPIETFGYVLEGEIISTFEGKAYRYKAGDVFYEDPNGLHNGTVNASKTKPAKLLVMFLGDAGKPFLIPEKHQ